MRSWSLPLLLLLSIFVGLFIPPDARAGTNADAKIAGHLKAHTTKAVCTTWADRPPCNPGESHLNVQGQVGVAYDLYLMVLDGDSTAGVAGAVFGIAYDGAPQSGVDIMGWTLCADLQYPGGPSGIAWPDSGSGNLITWVSTTNCQRTPAAGDLSAGVTCVIGALYVYAYGEDQFELTPRLYAPRQEFEIADCDAKITPLDYPSGAGSIGFGSPFPGHDPCSPTDTIPPANIPDLEIVDPGSPSGINDLAAALFDGELRLAWTAPADRGGSGTRAFAYDLRVRRIGAETRPWNEATSILTRWLPKGAGQREEHTVHLPVLQSGYTYEVNLRSLDASGNLSGDSNSTTFLVPIVAKDVATTVPRGQSHVWVDDHEITDSLLVLAVRDGQFSINGVTPTPLPSALPIDSTSPQAIDDAPYIQGLHSRGLSLPAARHAYHAAIGELEEAMRGAFTTQGLQGAKQTAEHSALVEWVKIQDARTLTVMYKGWVAPVMQPLVLESRPDLPATSPAYRLYSLVLDALTRSNQPQLILVTEGLMAQFTGQLATQYEGVIRAVVTGQGGEGLTSCPLDATPLGRLLREKYLGGAK